MIFERKIKNYIIYKTNCRCFLLKSVTRTAAILRTGPSLSILALQSVATVFSNTPPPSGRYRAQSWEGPFYHRWRRDTFGPKHIRTSISQKPRSGTSRYGDGIYGHFAQKREWIQSEWEGTGYITERKKYIYRISNFTKQKRHNDESLLSELTIYICQRAKNRNNLCALSKS